MLAGPAVVALALAGVFAVSMPVIGDHPEGHGVGRRGPRPARGWATVVSATVAGAAASFLPLGPVTVTVMTSAFTGPELTTNYAVVLGLSRIAVLLTTAARSLVTRRFPL